MHPLYCNLQIVARTINSYIHACIIIHILVASLGLDEYEILKDELQDKLYENANTISCERLALALYSESSIQKCPYLAQDSTTRKKIKSFVSIAKPNGCCISLSEDENFRANYAILTEALDIADTIDLHYTKVIKKALELSKSRKGMCH